MNTSSQFPALIGKNALPAMARERKAPVKNNALTHPLGITKMSHPLVKTPQPGRVGVTRPPAVPKVPAVAAPPNGDQEAINALKASTKLGQLASFAAQTNLRKAR